MKSGITTNEEREMDELSSEETIAALLARIAELELEMLKLQKAAEKGEKLLKVMWGDDFNDDFLF